MTSLVISKDKYCSTILKGLAQMKVDVDIKKDACAVHRSKM